jgi:uncharacterized protein (TIGR02271 family)
MTDRFSTTPADIPTPLLKKEDALAAGRQHVLQVLEEQINIQKVVVETGAVRVRKIVHEETDTVDISLITEEVIVTRVPVDKVVSNISPSRQDEDTLVIPIFKEVFIRQIVLVEEVHITTRRSPNSTTQKIKLKREEAIVERYDAQTGLWHPDTSQ